MKLLALEFSTDSASLALLQDGELVAALPVAAGHRRSQELFDAAPALLAQCGWSLRDVAAFAVGRGPGSYTGLRVSLTAARGWALPENKPVWTVASAAARAAEAFAEDPNLPRVVVSGEARRGSLWAGLYERTPAAPRLAGDWQLLPVDARHREWPGVPWADPARPPQAAWVGRLFFAGAPSEDLQPIYLHPAVVAAPRFDAHGKPLA